jgi:hypothetical protein
MWNGIYTIKYFSFHNITNWMMADFLNLILAYMIFDSYERVQLSCAISLLTFRHRASYI